MSFAVSNDDKENLGIELRKRRSRSVGSQALRDLSNVPTHVPEQIKTNKTKSSHLVPSWNLDKEIRGTCEIFNFKKFVNRPDLTREGTDSDALNLKNTFDNLRIQTIIHQDLKKHQVLDRLHQLTNDPQQVESQIYVCVFLSHGGEISGSNTITTHDNKFIDIDTEVLPLFSDDKCATLSQKPKIFVIQACRGKKLNVAVGDSAKVEALPFNQFPKELSIQEACVINATLPFYVALRHEETGSDFINVLCDTLRNHADNAEFKELMLIVNKKIIEKKTDVIVEGEIVPNVRMVPEERYIGWTKTLYLGTNPEGGSDPPKSQN